MFCFKVRNIIPTLQQDLFASFLLVAAEDLLIGQACVWILDTESRWRRLDDVDIACGTVVPEPEVRSKQLPVVYVCDYGS